MPRNPDKTRCTHPDCRAWAVRGSDPPLCVAHAGRAVGAGAPPGNQNRRTHGFYGRILQPDEANDLHSYGKSITIDSEIGIARVALRRVFDMLETHATPGPDPQPIDVELYVRLLTLAFRGAGTISRLLSIRQQLPEAQDDRIHESLVDAYIELRDKWGIKF